jgi:tRNA pseudouridine13 synthase
MFIHGIQGYLFNRILCARLRLGYSLSTPIEGDLVASIDARGMPMKIYTMVTTRNLEKAQKAILNGQAEIVGPLLGYGSQIPQNAWGDAMVRILEEEHLELDAFRALKCRFFESSGTQRPIRVKPSNVHLKVTEDDQNPGYTKVEANFDLGKGSYATVLLRELMKTAPEDYV